MVASRMGRRGGLALDPNEALEVLRRALAPAAPSPTVRVLAERWADVHRGRLQDFKTEEGRLAHVVAFFGDRDASTLTIFDIDGEKGYRAHRRGQKKQRGGGELRPATINREVTLLQRVLNFAVKEKLLRANPIKHAKPEPENNIQQSKIESEAKLQALLKASDTAITEALILCLFETGARRMEIMGMRWDWFDGEWLVFPKTKNRQPRRVKLAPRALAALKRLRRIEGSPFVFTNPRTKRRYNPRTLSRFFELAVRDSGLEGVNGESLTPHKCRHGAAYRFRRKFRLPTETARKMLGQKTDAAFRRYGIVDDEETEEAWNIAALEKTTQHALDRRPPQRAQPIVPVDEALHAARESETSAEARARIYRQS